MLVRILSALCLATLLAALSRGSDGAPKNPVFARLDGEWMLTYEVDGQPAGSGTEVHSTRPGSRWHTSEFDGDFGGPYLAHGVLGYDEQKGEYTGYYFDEQNAEPTVSRGRWDGEAQVLTRWSDGVDFAGKSCRWRQELDLSKDGAYDLVMYTVYPDGEERLVITCEGKRVD